MLQRLMRREEDRVALPERVRSTITRQEQQAELVIALVQTALLVTFSILYALTPPPVNETAFQPVGLFLAIYGAFTAAKLWLCWRRTLPSFVVDMSIIIDMGLLMGLIWSFHIQYDQPPSFYLKAPTLLYVFIFIALRALRFEPRFIIFAGAAAVSGWGLLVIYAIKDDLTQDMITRDYIAYLTGNHILLGAEFDKMISIILVSVILAVAVSRGRSLLITAVKEAQAAADLRRFFDPIVASTITGSERVLGPGEGETRNAAILMLDIRGFTRRAATQSPQEVIGMLADYQARMVPIILKHGGQIDKFLGDGIMATFGAVRPTVSYAFDALAALEEIVEAAEVWQADLRAEGETDPPRVNGGVAVGEVVVGAVGVGDRLEFTVIGDPVNLAAKLEGANKIEKTWALASRKSFDMATTQGFRPRLSVENRPQFSVPGTKHTVDLVAWI